MLKFKRGFTLIELLVVVSIIALLVAILMPALNIARQQATGAACLGNQKGLNNCYIMYADDNEGKLVGGFVPTQAQTPAWPVNYNQWVYPPYDAARLTQFGITRNPADAGWKTLGGGPAPTLQDRIAGFKMGALWKYTQSEELYHCPGDKRFIKGSQESGLPLDHQYIYRSYSLPDGLSAHDFRTETNGAYNGDYANPLKRVTQVKRPAESYNFVEEMQQGGGATGFNFNHGGWSFSPWVNNNHQWWDTLGAWHNNAATFSFFDGHAEIHKWDHKETSEAFKTNFYNRANLTPRPAWNINQDFLWLWRNYPDKHPVQ